MDGLDYLFLGLLAGALLVAVPWLVLRMRRGELVGELRRF